MRIVTRAEFMNLPEGTVYQEYTPCAFDILSIKTEKVGDFDFRYVKLSGSSFDCGGSDELYDTLEDARLNGTNIQLSFSDEESFRDGSFDDKQLYAVWSPQDIGTLIEKLKSIQGVQNPRQP